MEHCDHKGDSKTTTTRPSLQERWQIKEEAKHTGRSQLTCSNTSQVQFSPLSGKALGQTGSLGTKPAQNWDSKPFPPLGLLGSLQTPEQPSGKEEWSGKRSIRHLLE